MRVIICGAGQVGYSIAEYLAKEENDITVIDIKDSLIRQMNEDLDVNGIVGHASSPEVLARAGAEEADMIIAVTHIDEVNMVACQVAHSLFNIPKKIARVRNQTYLDPAWSNLFSRAHMPIDVIISPEIEVARAINQRLLTPGTTNILGFGDDATYLVGVHALDNCPVLNTQIKQFSTLFPDLKFRIAGIVREGEALVPTADDQVIEGDEVFFFIEAAHLRRAMAVFGHEEKDARHVVIMGGGNIGLYLTKLIQERQKDIEMKIIEYDEERARFLSQNLKKVTVLHGDALERDLLEEANISKTDTLIAVTNDDETNILGSLLAKQHGCERAITLVNNAAYPSLMSHLGIDAVVSPRSSTVSRIMQNVRRGRIKALHTVMEGMAEVIEAEVSESTSFANVPYHSLELPEGVILGSIVRDHKNIDIEPDTIIKPGDHVVILSLQEQARKVEKMFTVQVDIF